MNDEILRSEFEMSALFQTANETVGDITYKNFGGYFIKICIKNNSDEICKKN